MKWKRSKKAQQEAKQRASEGSVDHKSNSNSSLTPTEQERKTNTTTSTHENSNALDKKSSENTSRSQVSSHSNSSSTSNSMKGEKSSSSSAIEGNALPLPWSSNVARHLAECGRSVSGLSHHPVNGIAVSQVQEPFYRPYVS